MLVNFWKIFTVLKHPDANNCHNLKPSYISVSEKHCFTVDAEFLLSYDADLFFMMEVSYVIWCKTSQNVSPNWMSQKIKYTTTAHTKLSIKHKILLVLQNQNTLPVWFQLLTIQRYFPQEDKKLTQMVLGRMANSLNWIFACDIIQESLFSYRNR